MAGIIRFLFRQAVTELGGQIAVVIARYAKSSRLIREGQIIEKATGHVRTRGDRVIYVQELQWLSGQAGSAPMHLD